MSVPHGPPPPTRSAAAATAAGPAAVRPRRRRRGVPSPQGGTMSRDRSGHRRAGRDGGRGPPQTSSAPSGPRARRSTTAAGADLAPLEQERRLRRLAARGPRAGRTKLAEPLTSSTPGLLRWYTRVHRSRSAARRHRLLTRAGPPSCTEASPPRRTSSRSPRCASRLRGRGDPAVEWSHGRSRDGHVPSLRRAPPQVAEQTPMTAVAPPSRARGGDPEQDAAHRRGRVP